MEIAVFARLEQRVDKLLDRLSSVNQKNAHLSNLLEEKEQEVQRLAAELEALRAEEQAARETMEQEVARLNQALAAREGEREEVRRRVEQLVLKLESI